MLRPPGPLRPWPRRQSANCDRSSGMALPLTCLHPTTQNTTNERRKKGNLALRYPIPLLQMSNTPPPRQQPWGHGEAVPGLKRKEGRTSQPGLLAPAFWLKDPRHRARQSWAFRPSHCVSGLSGLRCWPGRSSLCFPESRGWRSWHDTPLACQIPFTGSLRQVLSELM